MWKALQKMFSKLATKGGGDEEGAMGNRQRVLQSFMSPEARSYAGAMQGLFGQQQQPPAGPMSPIATSMAPNFSMPIEQIRAQQQPMTSAGILEDPAESPSELLKRLGFGKYKR